MKVGLFGGRKRSDACTRSDSSPTPRPGNVQGGATSMFRTAAFRRSEERPGPEVPEQVVDNNAGRTSPTQCGSTRSAMRTESRSVGAC
jgi:hypothetical protein